MDEVVSNGNGRDDSPYAGRWVARVRGRVVAQGGTPEEARQASQASRPKEKAEIEFVPLPLSLHPLIETLQQALPRDLEVHLVGGGVRDMLLGRPSTDLDFVLAAGGIRTARQVARSLHADYVTLDEERDVGRAIVSGEDGSRTFLDFAGLRGKTLEEDLRARDFTINALAFEIHRGSILDPLRGAQDLKAGVIRACSATAVSDDPLRALRGVRLAAAFGFHIEKATREQIRRAADGLPRVSVERVRDELFRILDGPRPDACLRALALLGILAVILPELETLQGVKQSPPHIHDLWPHTLAVLSELDALMAALRPEPSPQNSNDLWTGLLSLRLGRFRRELSGHFATSLNLERSRRALLFLAALYHDVGKPRTRSLDADGRIRFLEHETAGAETAAERARSWNLSNAEIEHLDRLVRNHMRLHALASRMEGEGKPPSRRAIYRFFRAVGDAGVDLVLLGLADLRGTRGMTLTTETWSAYLEVARLLLENWWEKPLEAVSPPKLLGGHDLMAELNLPPGPLVGTLLEAIREEQAAGRVETRSQALDFAREKLRDHNPGES